MTSKTARDRIPLADLEAIIAKALEPGDYEHDSAYLDGHVCEVPTPPAHVVSLAVLTAGLPEPDPADGTADISEAAAAVLSVIEQRLAPHPYTLRAYSLVRRLTEESEAWEQAHGLTDTGVPEEASSSVLRCMVCTKPLSAGSKASRRTCSDACRQKLRRIRHGTGPVTVTS